MLSAAEIAAGDRYDDNEFCERFGVDKSRIARAERERNTGLPDGLFRAAHAQELGQKADRGLAGQKRYTVGRYESQVKQPEGEAA